MNYLMQALVIFLISFLGEGLHALLPLPVPASIYGLVLMLLALCTKTVKLPQVQDTAAFLVEIMPVMFVPPAVALIVRWADVKQLLLPVILAATLCTILTMAVSGLITQAMIRKQGSQKEERT